MFCIVILQNDLAAAFFCAVLFNIRFLEESSLENLLAITDLFIYFIIFLQVQKSFIQFFFFFFERELGTHLIRDNEEAS